MSLARLALRATTVDVLSNGNAPPFPTIAGGMVFDSRVDPPEHSAEETMLPAIIVYTNQDMHVRQTRNQDSSFPERSIQLFMDLIIATFTDAKDGISIVETDAEMEALLDLFEWQVWRTLYDAYNPRTQKWRKLVRFIDGWRSEPARKSEQANRLAMRQLCLDVSIANDCVPSAIKLPPAGKIALPEPKTLLDVPYLTAMEDALAKNPTFAVLREQLREARTGIPSRTIGTLESIHFDVDAIDPADPNRLPPGQTKGPDGRVEWPFVAKTGETP